MNYLSVPEDFSKIKNKVFMYLTLRQLICFGIAAVYGIVFYFFARQSISSNIASMGMVIIMLPGFLAGIYEKNGRYAEQIIWDIITFFILRPRIRRYEMEDPIYK